MPGSLSGEVCASHHKPDLMQKTGQFKHPETATNATVKLTLANVLTAICTGA